MSTPQANNQAAPLHGLKVVELAEGVAGPYAGKLLADFGAEVIKVEPAAGDRSRRLGPFPPNSTDPERSALFLHLSSNKRSVQTSDKLTLERLFEWADVVIQSEASPDPALIRERHSSIVIASVTSFGLTGPLAGMVGEEIVHFAYGGPMSATGHPDREPLKMGGDLGQYQCGTVAAVSILAALAQRDRSGHGCHIDISNVETQVGSIDRRMTYLLYAAYRGQNVPRSGGYRIGALPNGCRPTLDGQVQIATLFNWLPKMLAVVDNPELANLYEDPAAVFDEDLPEQADAHLLGWTLSNTKQQAMELAQSMGWPVTAVNAPADLLADKHFAERGFFTTIEHSHEGQIRVPGAPIRMAGGWSIRRPPPLLGQHSAEVLAELDERQYEPKSKIDGQIKAEPTLALDDVRVLDMTVVWAGPYATCILGDLGAEVIRIDNPWVFPSATRGVLPRPPKEVVEEIGGTFGGYPDADPGARPWNRIALFNAHARNKKSVTLDLRKSSGVEAFLRLVDNADLLIENNSVELLPKLGLDWETLHKRNPSLIVIRMPSVGLEGPYQKYRGFGVNFEALCGLSSLRGYLDSDPTENEAVFHMDAASGSAGAYAALMALRRRKATGVGEFIELSQSENMLNHIGEYLIDAERTGTIHATQGNRHPIRAPQGCYPCNGEDQWVVISVGSDIEWQSLLDLVSTDIKNDLADERFVTAQGRHQHHDEIDELLSSWTKRQSAREVFFACQGKGIASAPVLHDLETYKDTHLNERGMFRPNGNADTGTHLYPAHLWHWDGPDLRWGPLPTLGSDNEQVLKEIAGLSDEEYSDLRAGGHLSESYLDPTGEPF